MTARQVFEATLIELSKIQAPSLKLYEFNYLFNKAINLYINKVYNVYDINQQTTDDLRVLKATAFLTPHKIEIARKPKETGLQPTAVQQFEIVNDGATQQWNPQTGNLDIPKDGYVLATSYLSRAHRSIQSLHGATYEVYMPIDYLHMLNCVCIYYVAKLKDCWDAGSYIEIPATRLTADSWSQIVTDIYNRPSPMRPYYYIHNLNQQESVPTNSHTDMDGIYHVTTVSGGEFTKSTDNNIDTDSAKKDSSLTTPQKTNFQRTFTLKTSTGNLLVSLIEKPIALRAGNTSNVRCEIRYGNSLNKNQ